MAAKLIARWRRTSSRRSTPAAPGTVSVARTVVFRGWATEVDHVAKALSDEGIPSERLETLVPAIIGGSLLVCEIFVQVSDFRRACRVVARVVGGAARV